MSTSTTTETGWAIRNLGGFIDIESRLYQRDVRLARIYRDKGHAEAERDRHVGYQVLPITRTITVEIGSPEETGQS